MDIQLLTGLYFVSIVVCLTVGVLLFAIKSEYNPKEELYLRTKYILGVATLLVAAVNISVFMEVSGGEQLEMMSLPVVTALLFQACLFMFLVLVMFHSSYVTMRNIIKHLLPTFVLLFIYLVAIFFQRDVAVYSFKEYFSNLTNVPLIVRTLFVVVFAVQICYFVRLHRRQRKIYLAKISGYFSDLDEYCLGRASQTFYESMVLGVVVMILCIAPYYYLDLVAVVLVTTAYFRFAVRYINHQYRLSRLLPAVDVEEPSVEPEPERMKDPGWSILDDALIMYVEAERPYLIKNIVVADIAKQLNVAERKLSYHIHNTYGLNFNAWVNSLRVEYAKRVLRSNPNVTFEEIANMSGFSDRSKFSRTFKDVEGVSYRDYKKGVRL